MGHWDLNRKRGLYFKKLLAFGQISSYLLKYGVFLKREKPSPPLSSKNTMILKASIDYVPLGFPQIHLREGVSRGEGNTHTYTHLQTDTNTQIIIIMIIMIIIIIIMRIITR